MIKSYKYRLYPTKKQTETLEWTLRHCCELYNAALQERKEAWKYAKKSVSYYDQSAQLPEIKEIRNEYKLIGAHVLQNVLKRVDFAFQTFFLRVKAGEKAGYPRYRSSTRYDSFCYPDKAGWKLDEDRLALTNIGHIKIKLHREIEGKIKTLTIKREGTHWYAVFACEVEVEKLPVSYEDVGIDLGITHFAALSDGTFIDNPRHYRRAEKKLARLQQALSRKKRGSHRRKKAVQAVAKAHRKIRNQRKDFQHKTSRQLVNRYQVIVFEDLQAANMSKAPKPKQDENGKYLPNGASAKAGLNKSIRDAGWAMFAEMVNVKAASAGRTVIFVNPYKTSQYCSGCGVEVKKDLSVRIHNCPDCGLKIDRDTNAAINILALGKKTLSGGTRPTSATA